MTHERCSCPECLRLDELPDDLKGWPDSWQYRLIPTDGLPIMEAPSRPLEPESEPESDSEWERNQPKLSM